MKKILLLAVAALIVTSAGAQLKQRGAVNSKNADRTINHVQKPQALLQEMHPASANPTFVTNGPKKADGYVDAFWRRPAGVFPGIYVMENGAYGGAHYMPFYLLKPYVDYEFLGIADGADDDALFSWEYLKYVYNDGWEQPLLTYEGNPLTVNYVWGENDEVPTLIVETPSDGNMYFYQPGGYEMSGTADNPVVGDFHVSYILSYVNSFEFYEEEGEELLMSSKTMPPGGRHADQYYMNTYYSGAKPYGDNEEGWWFGKNAGRDREPSVPINGIAQAFEKPTAPYMLKQVVVNTAVLEVTGPVEMTCHVYKLADGLPAYDPDRAVALPEIPGEEIAYGKAMLTPETNETTDGLIIFTLYGEEDGLEYEITPTIDDAIIICVDGYNDEGMENLKDFTAMVCADDLSDEGYGELAYIKYGLTDDEGNFTGDYVWAGLNNFFSSGAMMTGLSIFITAEHPFLTFNYNIEDGEYTFPDEGGLMEKVLYEDEDETLVTRSIEFFSYTPSVDEGWTLTCDGDDVPDWLSIELIDGEENGEFDNSVLAEVTAEPLPEGVTYREAVVRFGFPGAYLDYTFKQGTPSDYKKGDVNGDGDVNIGDINALISIILGGEDNTEGRSDVNGDTDVNIGDINAVIAIILGGGE